MSKAEDEVKKYFNKYFKPQYFNKDDHEFKALVRIINKHHQSRVNDISNDDIDKQLPIYQSIHLSNFYVRKGAKWFKNKLLKQ